VVSWAVAGAAYTSARAVDVSSKRSDCFIVASLQNFNKRRFYCRSILGYTTIWSQVAVMPAKGHKRKWCHARVMSVLPLKADIRQRIEHVCFVPKADVRLG
jgi:hypothetical protein